MALQMRCEKGHSYIAPDIVVGDIEGPICPECRKEWLKEKGYSMWTLEKVSVVHKAPTTDILTITGHFQTVTRGKGKDLAAHTMRITLKPSSGQEEAWKDLEKALLQTVRDQLKFGVHDVDEFYKE